jgi:hypothetical protein
MNRISSVSPGAKAACGKRLSAAPNNNRFTDYQMSGPRTDGIIPFRMKGVSLDVQAAKLLIAHADPFLIRLDVEFTTDSQPLLCGSCGDELDDDQAAVGPEPTGFIAALGLSPEPTGFGAACG